MLQPRDSSPTKTRARNDLERAGVAGLLLTTEAMIADRPERNKKSSAGGDAGGGGGYGEDMDF